MLSIFKPLTTLFTTFALIVILATVSSMAEASPNQLNSSVDPAIVEATERYMEVDTPSTDQVQFIVDSTYISGDYAVAGYTYGEMGGVVLLRRTDDTWTPIEADGGVWNAEALVRRGVPQEDAENIWQQLLQAP